MPAPERGAAPQPDSDSADWLASLAPDCPGRPEGLSRLHALLLRAARTELARPAPRVQVTGPELDDLAHQAADDALMSITRKLASFRGDSRFTTWAYKFAILEVSAKIGRHFWQQPRVPLDAGQWDRLPDRFGLTPEQAAESADLLAAVRRAVEEELTSRQRQVFTALVIDGIPLDALAVRLGTSRNALYKMMFDARGKIRAALVANGYLCETTARQR
jgi:RNA polymerase sigma-70 factor, ECF subfamily